MNFRNVLVVAAHPDDEVLGVGGTIPLIKRNGGNVTVLIVTDGSTTQYNNDKDMLLRKFNQAQEASRILGSDEIIQWDFPDMRLDTVEHYKLNQAFEFLIKKKGFDTVFTHNIDDINMDHQIIFKSVLVATRPTPGQTVKQLLSYYVSSSTEWGAYNERTVFCPNYYININETIEIKLEAMRVYDDELREYPHPRSIEAIRMRAAVYGCEVGFKYAEPFKIVLYRGGIN